jgi:hypothetical protein
MNVSYDSCFKHGKDYQFIGCDSHCQLNCRICYDCLRGLDSGHRKGVSNHETISMEQLAMHFEKLEKYSHESIVECTEALEKYFRSFESLMQEEMQKEKQRLMKFVRRILLTGITKDERKLEVIMGLYNKDCSEITCQQVENISSMLFNFVPKNNHIGFKKFMEHLNVKQSEVFNEVKEIMTSRAWSKAFLKTVETDLDFPDFGERARSASRVKTEEESPKKTLRRSIRKEFKKMDLKEINVSLKKPLELGGSKLVDGRE